MIAFSRNTDDMGGPRRGLVFILAAILLFIGAPARGAAPDALSIGSKNFTESVILGEMARGLLLANGIGASHRKQMGGTRILWNALRRGDIDLYPEYTGTIRQEIYAERKDIGSEATLRAALAKDGIGMTRPLGFANNYAIGMAEDRAAALEIATISDLSRASGVRLGFSNEFIDRADGWPGLRRVYNFSSDAARGLDHDLAYRALAEGEIDAIDLYSTDAEIAYYGLRVLKDDRGHFPNYDAVFLYRLDRAEAVPFLSPIARLEGAIDENAMAGLNKAVKIGKQPETDAAAEFLQRELGVSSQLKGEAFHSRLLRRTGEHLILVLVSLIAATIIAIPLGIFAHRHARMGQAALAVTGILQTVPGLAMLVFMIPLFGIGAAPAMAALFLYSLLPIVRNTHAGLAEIDRSLIEAAEIFGLTRYSRLRRIELPLALPIILAGIKTSAVINIGTATLGAIIGAGGYGQPILTGIRLDDMTLILEGAVPAALMAIAAQTGFDYAEKRLRRAPG